MLTHKPVYAFGIGAGSPEDIKRDSKGKGTMRKMAKAVKKEEPKKAAPKKDAKKAPAKKK
jgi:hypothetical protein